MTSVPPAPPVLLCVHPHPDDESIACGGVLARAAEHGVRTVVVTCTGGEEGENLAGIDLGGEDLVTHRRRELAAALTALGVHRHHALGYRDSGMVGTAGNQHPDSFHAAEVEVAALALAAIIRTERPQVVVSDDELGTYGHPDHVKAHQVTVRAVELAADAAASLPGTVWRVPKRYSHTLAKGRLLAIHRALLAAGLASPFGEATIERVEDLPLGTPDERITTEVDVAPWLDRKRAAMAAHRSQIGPDSFFLNTPDDLVTSLFATEQFILESGTSGGDERPEPDLFAGLPAAAPPPPPTPSSVVSPPTREGSTIEHRQQPHQGQASSPDPESTHPDLGVAAPTGPSPTAFRAAMGGFLTGVAVMTTHSDDGPHGMTANAVSSVSLAPPLVLVCVDRRAHMATAVAEAGMFALSFLAEDQAALSNRFADPARGEGEQEFDGVSYSVAATGARVLDGVVGFVDCRVATITEAGDHLVVIGEVVGLGTNQHVAPLAYFRGGYGQFLADPAVDRAVGTVADPA